MKKRFTCLLLLTGLFLCGKEPWHEPDAAYRMIVELKDAEKDGFWSDSDWLLPCAEGFAPVVYADGKKLPVPPRGLIPKGKTKKRILYFGYPNAPCDNSQKRDNGVPGVVVRSLEGKNGEEYPLIQRHLEAVIPLNKKERIHLLYFKPISEGDFIVRPAAEKAESGMEWKLPGCMLLMPGAVSEFSVTDAAGKFQTLKLSGRKISPFHNTKEMQTGIRLDCPDYGYSDEDEKIIAGVWNYFGKVLMTDFQVSDDGKVWRSESSQAVLPVKNGDYQFVLNCGDFRIAAAAWRGIPVEEIASLSWKRGAGFFDENGVRTTILLDRPKLNEARKWEAWKKFCYKLQFFPSVLRINSSLKNSTGGLYFPEESPLQNGLLMFHQEILTSDADELQLILPCFAAVAPQEAWKRERALAALFELIVKNTGFLKKTIYLPQETEAEMEEPDYIQWRESVQRLCRDYHLDLAVSAE